jgi:hypothetical protein
VEAVDFGGSPPPELELGWSCERWHTLPEAGGYLDQPMPLMQKIHACLNVHSAVSRLRSMKGAQIHQLTDSERRLIKWLLEESMLNG